MTSSNIVKAEGTKAQVEETLLSYSVVGGQCLFEMHFCFVRFLG